MRTFTKKQFKEKYPHVIIPLLRSVTSNEEDLLQARDSLFNNPLKAMPGQTHVHVQRGFARIIVVPGQDFTEMFLHYEVEFVVTSWDLKHVGATLRSAIVYDNEQQFEAAKAYADMDKKNQMSLNSLKTFMQAIRKHFPL